MNRSTLGFAATAATVVLATFSAPAHAQEASYQESSNQEPSLERVWATDAVFDVPESVAFDSTRGVLYVANISGAPSDKDGRGFLSILELDGTVRSLQWVGGLHAPKGTAVHGDRLYVADIDHLIEVALPGGEIVSRHALEGAQFANGVDVAGDGTVYVTDTANGRIYRVHDGAVELWLEDERLGGINGVLVEESRLLVGTFSAGGLWAVDLETTELTALGGGYESFDGIVAAPGGGYLVSDWNGRILWTDGEGGPTTLLDTRADEIGAADIEVVASQRLLLVPTFADGRVVAYRLAD